MISNKSSESSKTISSPIKARKRFRAFSVTTLITLTTFTTAQNIWDIQASFCNPEQSEKEIDLIAKAWTNSDICINFSNNSLKDTTISIDFVDGVITPTWESACFSAEKPKPNFGQYIENYDTKLAIPGNSSIEQHFKIQYPVGYSWVSHGCLGYSIDNTKNIAGWISMIFRKTHTIDILVGWTKINSKLIIQNAKYSDNKLIFTVENQWNITQNISITGTISNLLWYSQEFNTESTDIQANSETIIATSELMLPQYKWFFSINSNIYYHPKFNFDITNHNIDTQYTTPGTVSIFKLLILRNWYYIAGLSIIGLLMAIIVIKRIK